MNSKIHLLTVLVCASLSALPVCGTLIPGSAEIFTAGQLGGTAVLAANVTSFQELQIIAAGSVSGAGCVSSTPDGCGYFTSNLPGTGLARYVGPAQALVGVFLDEAIPNGIAPSAYIDQLGAAMVGPALWQPFYIGVGVNSSGSAKRFLVPQGATRLFLGTSDNPGRFGNNYGSFDVQVTDTPEGGTFILVAMGLTLLSRSKFKKGRREGQSTSLGAAKGICFSPLEPKAWFHSMYTFATSVATTLRCSQGFISFPSCVHFRLPLVTALTGLCIVLFTTTPARAGLLSEVRFTVAAGNYYELQVLNDEPPSSSYFINSLSVTLPLTPSINSSPVGWVGFVSDTTAYWFNADIGPYPNDIAPGTALTGFSLTTGAILSDTVGFQISSWDHLTDSFGPDLTGTLPAPEQTPEPSSVLLCLTAAIGLLMNQKCAARAQPS